MEPQRVVSMGDELLRIQQEAHTMQEDIQQNLFHAIIRSVTDIDAALQWRARLDVIFAKAAWGDTMKGSIPAVGHEGKIEVEAFSHPVLALSSKAPESVVPVDLYLSSSDHGSPALIISGANGGGKTVALKSFGLACVLCKLGVPIPSSSSSRVKQRIDFMDDVLVEVGDKQSVIEGESTLMARLNACASLIQRVSDPEKVSQPRSSLVLLDELGGGTDPNAGSALAQAVLEKLIESPKCRVVATTHSPQLKALSLESKQFSCATVALKQDPFNPNGLQQPTFRLCYGSIGDSHALEAAHRCTPALPEDVLLRATDLLRTNESSDRTEGDSDRIGVLIRSLEQQAQVASDARISAEKFQKDSGRCRDAMLSLSEAYVKHLSGLEKRLENCFQKLNTDETKDKVDIVGTTLAELRVVQKKVKSDKELLRERGLKIAPDTYQFADGESVVILAKGEWEGEMAKIVLSEGSLSNALASNEVLVMLSFATWNGMSSPPLEELDQNSMPRSLVFKRFEVAIWDYDSVWEIDSAPSPVTSIRESQRKLFEVLSTVKSASSTKHITKSTGSSGRDKSRKKSFISARQRKAASREVKGKKSGKRRKK